MSCLDDWFDACSRFRSIDHYRDDRNNYTVRECLDCGAVTTISTPREKPQHPPMVRINSSCEECGK